MGAPDRRGGAGLSASPPGDVGLGGRRAAAPAARGLRRTHGPRGGDGGEAPPAAARGPPAGPRRRRTSAGLLRAPPGDSGPGRPPADPDQPEQRVFLERAVRQPGGAQRGMELLRLVGPRARPAHQSVCRDADGFGGGAGGRILLSRRARRAAPAPGGPTRHPRDRLGALHRAIGGEAGRGPRRHTGVRPAGGLGTPVPPVLRQRGPHREGARGPPGRGADDPERVDRDGPLEGGHAADAPPRSGRRGLLHRVLLRRRAGLRQPQELRARGPL